MKSVSFSDLRESSEMSNCSDASLNLRDPISTRSSVKQLTHYKSSEDILRRFSSRSIEKRTPTLDIDYSERQDSLTKTPDSPMCQQTDDLHFLQKVAQPQLAYEQTINDLRQQIAEKDRKIEKLQDENLKIQNESTKNSEQVKFMENRIKYLEHMLAAFSVKPDEINKSQNYEEKENTLKDKNREFYSPSPPSCNLDKCTNTDGSHIKRYQDGENTAFHKVSRDLNKRPNSADSLFNTDEKYYMKTNQREREGYPQQVVKSYDSDTEMQNDLRSRKFQQIPEPKTSTDFLSLQRRKFDRDRSSNLSEFKSRLDDFSKHARQSAEQNCLRNSTSAIYEQNQPMYSHTGTDAINEYQNRKTLAKDSRPPTNPYRKHKRINFDESIYAQDNMDNTKMAESQNYRDEDEDLKERVKKILERHNYPSQTSYNYGSQYDRNYQNFAGADQISSKSLSKIYSYNNEPAAEMKGNSYGSKYSFADSNVPKLDLSRQRPYSGAIDDETNELLMKYLNYTNVSNY